MHVSPLSGNNPSPSLYSSPLQQNKYNTQNDSHSEVGGGGNPRSLRTLEKLISEQKNVVRTKGENSQEAKILIEIQIVYGETLAKHQNWT